MFNGPETCRHAHTSLSRRVQRGAQLRLMAQLEHFRITTAARSAGSPQHTSACARQSAPKSATRDATAYGNSRSSRAAAWPHRLSLGLVERWPLE
eukprot:492623-Prymnesium_polylepis.1